MPFELLGFDTDNDSVFINETLRDYCRDAGIVFTRCRPWRKNDQAFVEQKNGAVVRRIVGYRRPKGLEAAAALSRLYVNFFQPSFKLASKRRDGARVSQRYHAPATPSRRLLELAGSDTRNGSASTTEVTKAKLEHRVPLCSPAVAVLDEAREFVDRRRPRIFPADRARAERQHPVKASARTRHRRRAARLPVELSGLGRGKDRRAARDLRVRPGAHQQRSRGGRIPAQRPVRTTPGSHAGLVRLPVRQPLNAPRALPPQGAK